MAEDFRVTRSDTYILFHLLNGLCAALELTMGARERAGPVTSAVLNALCAETCAQLKGKARERIECLPDIPEDGPLADKLALAELLRATMLSFLTPEEWKEAKDGIGYLPALGKAP